MAEFLAIEVEKKRILPPTDQVSFIDRARVRAILVAHLLSGVAPQPGPRKTVP